MRKNMRRWVGALLGIILVSNCGIDVRATGVNNTETTAVQGELTPEQKREQLLQEAYNKEIETNAISGWPQGPQIYGESAIVMDMQTGAILYGKGIDEQRYPASITKILTALVALENSSLTDMVTFSQQSVLGLENGYSHIGMKAGEQITMNDALHALMLASANEVAYAIGETVGGTHEHFIEMMNEKARELGCEGTHFINTNGIFDEEHYTTARDMALISKAAFEHQELLNIVQTLQYTVPATNLETETRTFQQKHKLIANGDFFDARCIGGKTGYTEEACNTLVSVMEEDGRKIVAVIMKSKKDTYPDTKKICDYAFQNFEEVNIAENEKSKKLKGIDPEACVTLPAGVSFDDLEWKLDDNGNLNYSYEGQLVGTTKASMKQDVKAVAEKKSEKKHAGKKNVIVIIAVVIAALLAGGGILYLLLLKRQRDKRRRERRRRIMRERRRRQERQDNLFD